MNSNQGKPRRWQQAAAALTLGIAATSAQADLAFEATDAFATRPATPAPLALATAPWETPAAAVPADARLTRLDDQQNRAFRLADSSGDLSLWAFMSSMRLLQQKQTFALMESNVRLIELSASNVAPVPLPGAAWLMVMGLAGMAGMRLTRGKAQQQSDAQAPPALLPMRA